MMLLVLAACSSSALSTSAPQSGARGTGQPEASQSPFREPLSGLGDRVTTPPGEVGITVSEEPFELGSPISALVANGLDQTIYTEDSQSDCSILLLERLETSRWEPVPGCNVRRPPLRVAIGSSRGRTVLIDPSSDAFLAVLGPTEVPLHEGTYRLTLTYRAHSGPSRLVSSAPFQITS